jgi:small subunit ribosomal protein S7
MPRRSRIVKREVEPDTKYNNLVIQHLINRMMTRGKKSTSQRVVYKALDIVAERSQKPPMQVFEEAMTNLRPAIEVKPRRVGGATLQVPVEVNPFRQESLAMRWLIGEARKRSGKTMSEKLAGELLDASTNNGAAVKKREETHKMAEANRAFAHFRW